MVGYTFTNLCKMEKGQRPAGAGGCYMFACERACACVYVCAVYASSAFEVPQLAAAAKAGPDSVARAHTRKYNLTSHSQTLATRHTTKPFYSKVTKGSTKSDSHAGNDDITT